MKKKGFLKLKPLHHEALKLLDAAPEPAQIRTRNVTALLEEEIRQRVAKGNLNNIQIRGEQTLGKSLVGFVLLLFINHLLKRKVEIWQICPDQFDFLDRAKDMSIKNVCMMIDEWNELSTTGYNATTNQALLTQFNEVQAQRYIHKIACSPEKVLDQTARIRLDILEKQPDEKVTYVMVSYVISKESQVFEQMIGYAEIDVSKGLEHPLWKAYRERKFKRMNLLMEKGIIDKREGDDSEIILKVVEEMRDLAIQNGFVQRDVIRSFIKYVQTKYMAISIWGEDKLTGTIYGILVLLKSIYQVNLKIKNLEKVLSKLEDKSSKEKAHYENQLKIWKESKVKLSTTFEKSIHFHEDVLKTLKEFAEIGYQSDPTKERFGDVKQTEKPCPQQQQ